MLGEQTEQSRQPSDSGQNLEDILKRLSIGKNKFLIFRRAFRESLKSSNEPFCIGRNRGEQCQVRELLL